MQRALALSLLDRLPSSLPPVIPRPLPFPNTTPALATVLRDLRATRMECNATGLGDDGAPAANQCIYLALAAAASGPGVPILETARSLRRHIEAAVRAARPGWAALDFLGQEVGAFADFLIWGLPASPLLRGRAVAVYNGPEGSCEIFRSLGPVARQRPVLALWFQDAHYEWLRWGGARGGPRLSELLARHRVGPANTPAVPTLVTLAAG